MGWSYMAAAMQTLQAIDKLMPDDNQVHMADGRRILGSWRIDDKLYFYEESRQEFEDGHISGTIYLDLRNGYCKQVSRFYIEPDGYLRQGPKLWRNLLGKAEDRESCEYHLRTGQSCYLHAGEATLTVAKEELTPVPAF